MKNKLLIKLLFLLTTLLCLPANAQFRNTVTPDKPVFIPYSEEGKITNDSTTQVQNGLDVVENDKSYKTTKEESEDAIFNRKVSKQVKISIILIIALLIIWGISGPFLIYTIPIALLIELIIYIIWYIHEMPYFY